MKLETVIIESLSLDPNNARKHSKRNLDAIAASLNKFGQRKPIVVHQNTVIAGNGTLEAAKTLGWTEISISRCPDDWDNDTAKAYALADNRSSELAEWDDAILATQLLDLDEMGWDIEDIGFSQKDLPDLTPVDEDEIPEPPVEPKTKLGDIYQLGRHRLMCGDSTDEATVNRLMDGEKADMVLTDPPYRYKPMGSGGVFDAGYTKLKDDLVGLVDFDPKAFLELLPKVFNQGLNAYIFCNTDLVFDYCNWAKANKYNFNILTWHKTSFIPASNNHHFPDTEYLIYISKQAVFNTGLNVNYGKYFVLNNEKHADHPTIKPLEILITEIKISSNLGGIVLDLFGGSGSTLIAAEQTNRACYMMELDPKYCDVIIKRWENLTGLEAELIP